MADKKISDLPDADLPLDGTELVAIVQNGVTKKVAISQIGGGGSTPLLSVTPDDLDFGDVTINTFSASQSFVISGTGLIANVLVTSPSPRFIVNDDNSNTNMSPMTVVPSSGSVTKTIYVKANPLAEQSYNANISITSTGAVSKVVAIEAVGVATLPNIQSAGGVVSYAAGKKIHVFEDVEDALLNFQVFSVPSGMTAELLVVAGGGCGGWGNGGAGGGAGGLIYDPNWAIASGIFPITIGIGGRGGNPGLEGLSGGNTIFGSLTAIGGGRGQVAGGEVIVESGGSGGGGARLVPPGNGTVGQGNNGSASFLTSIYTTGAGGGAAGPGVSSTTQNGIGGPGIQLSISGTPTYYSPGGGGGQTDGEGGIGLGGLGGGGNGGVSSVSDATSGTTYGAGGGGASSGGSLSQTGGDGYQGRVVISYNWTGAEVDYSYVVDSDNNTGIVYRDSAFNQVYSPSLAYVGMGYSYIPLIKDFYSTTDYVNFTPLPDCPIASNHFAQFIDDDGKIYICGQNISNRLIVASFDPSNSTWTTISANLDTGVYTLWGYSVGKKFYMACRNAITPSQIDIIKVDPFDVNNWSVDSVFPQSYCENSSSYVVGNTVRVFGGCLIDPGNNATTNFNPNVYEKTYPGGSWTIVKQILPTMQGAWPAVILHDGLEFMFAGLQQTDPVHQGSPYISFPDSEIWGFTGIEELHNNHAYTPSIFNGEIIMFGGSDPNPPNSPNSHVYRIKRNH